MYIVKICKWKMAIKVVSFKLSSMASVAPPDVWYSLQLPLDIINERKLSALQLESVVYASQQHEKLLPSGKRAGFLIGKIYSCFYYVSHIKLHF